MTMRENRFSLMLLRRRKRNNGPVSVLTFGTFQQRATAKGARSKDKQNYALGLSEYSSAPAL
jgi:hypothetical protein